MRRSYDGKVLLTADTFAIAEYRGIAREPFGDFLLYREKFGCKEPFFEPGVLRS
jgi:hypothetical protein